MRIPEEVTAAVQAWPGRWDAVENSGEGLRLRIPFLKVLLFSILFRR